MIGVSREVLRINDEVVICVKFPELAVDDVEMLIGEVVSHSINILFFLQASKNLREGEKEGEEEGEGEREVKEQ